MCKVSIIIPCYNIANYISKCIDSLLAQTFDDIEILLIDDGSSDATFEICELYQQKDNRIRLFTHPNQGVSYTRNRGIKEAKGEFVFFVDGDDYLERDYIARYLSEFQKGVQPTGGLITVEKGSQKKHGTLLHLIDQFNRKECISVIDLLDSGYLNTQCCKLYERSILIENNILFDETISYQEDLLFNLQYCQYLQIIKPIDYYGYYYVQHCTSSSSKFHKRFNHIEKIWKELLKHAFSYKERFSIQEFIFQSIMKKIENAYHLSSNKTSNERKEELKEMFAEDYFQYIYDYIAKSPVNPVLRKILILKRIWLLDLYYKLLGKIKHG